VTPLLALFDVDGTLLVGGDPVSNAAFLPAIHDLYGVELPADAVSLVDHPGQTCQRIAREVLRAEGLADEAIDERLRAWCARYAERYVRLLAEAVTTQWQAAPHAAEALGRLQEAGIQLALLTGNPEPMARARMARLGLDGFFPEGHGAFGCDAEERPELIRIAVERAGGHPLDRTAAVGDTPRDVSGAHSAGIRAVSVTPGDDLNEAADTLLAWNRMP
jgi:phosphoglycolate phosphatase-like HAD superfamily hydrolase